MRLQKFFKRFVLTAIALYLTAAIVPGVVIQVSVRNLALVTLIFMLLNMIVKPIVKLLLLPLNLLTFGAFRWLVSLILFYLLSLSLDTFTLTASYLPDTPLIGSVLPQATMSRFFTALTGSFVFSFLYRLLRWVGR